MTLSLLLAMITGARARAGGSTRDDTRPPEVRCSGDRPETKLLPTPEDEEEEHPHREEGRHKQRRQQERPPPYDPEHDHPEAQTSPTGSYSMHSRGFSQEDAYEADGGRGLRFVGTREWSRHHQESSSTLTGTGSVDPSHGLWSGPGRDLSRERERERDRDRDRDYEPGRRASGGRRYLDLEGSEMYVDDEDFAPYPFTQEASLRSGLSHDLTGFSEYDVPVSGEDGPPYDPAMDDDRNLYMTGAAAAVAAAEANNRAAAKEKERVRVATRHAGKAVVEERRYSHRTSGKSSMTRDSLPSLVEKDGGMPEDDGPYKKPGYAGRRGAGMSSHASGSTSAETKDEGIMSHRVSRGSTFSGAP